MVPPFPGLRRFPHGRRFKQWTGDNSKALMKVPHWNYSIQNSILNINSLQVYLLAISGYVPSEMVTCISAFLNIFYLARQPDIDEATLVAFDSALK